MKSFVVLGLFAAAGCNQILGLEPTVPVDAGQPPDAPLPIARLTWLVADTDTAGAPLPAPLLTPIDPAPTVQVGRIDGPLTATPYLPDGSFTIPADFPGTPWRVVYEVPGAATPVEVQWTTSAERIPHLTEPFIGHLPRMPLPGPASAMTVTPTGTGVSFSSARVAFTGVWGESPTASAAGSTLTFNLNNVVPFTGPKGSPEPALGDRVVVLTYSSVTSSSGASCRTASGGAQFEVMATAGTVTKAPGWYTGTSPNVAVSLPFVPFLIARDGVDRATGGTTEMSLWFGKAATQTTPMFTYRRNAGEVRMPAMISLFECILGSNTFGVDLPPLKIADPPFLTLPGLGVGRFMGSRTIAGTSIRLVSGYVAAATSIDGSYVLDTRAAVPAQPFTLGSTDLAVDDHVALAAGTGPLTLTFGFIAVKDEDMAPDTSDYYEVVLHQVTTTGTTPLRTFRVPGRSVSIDRGLLTAGSEYVFELRSFAGAPQANMADFTAYTSPQSQGTVFTRTFIAP